MPDWDASNPEDSLKRAQERFNATESLPSHIIEQLLFDVLPPLLEILASPPSAWYDGHHAGDESNEYEHVTKALHYLNSVAPGYVSKTDTQRLADMLEEARYAICQNAEFINEQASKLP